MNKLAVVRCSIYGRWQFIFCSHSLKNLQRGYTSLVLGGFPTMAAHPTQGGYTSLLGLHQDASAARRLQFDEVSNPATFD